MTPEQRPAVHSNYVDRHAKRGWSQARDERVAELWRGGATLNAIAEELQVSTTRVRDLTQRLLLHRAIEPRRRA